MLHPAKSIPLLFGVLLLAILLATVAPVRAAEDIQFEDFEKPLQGWSATGDAFATGPVAGTLPGQQPVSRYHGEKLINSFVGGDGAQGTLTSPTFKLSRRFIRILVGGGKKPGECEVQLFVDGTLCYTQTGCNDEVLRPCLWNVAKWAGHTARLTIIDHSAGGWGHILVDNIVFTDDPAHSSGQALDVADDILFEDFEHPLHGWTATGDAFTPGPVAGMRPNQNLVQRYQGAMLINSFFNGDGGQGTLTSPVFTITRKFIVFLVGGGNKPGECEIELYIDNTLKYTQTGADDEILRPGLWNVSSWLGHQAKIVIIDQSTEGWGHILVDYILFSDDPCHTAGQNIDMIFIPAGECQLGEVAWQPDWPSQRVTLPAFFIDRYEVTTEEFARFLNATGKTRDDRGEWFRAKQGFLLDCLNGKWAPRKGFERYPVGGVSWYGATAYATWVGKRLPTEAEWERAARGNEGHPWPWGNDYTGMQNCNVEEERKALAGLLPVGSFPAGASIYGVCDLEGNVAEWTSSLYKPYPYNAQDGREDPQASGPRVVRGAPWNEAFSTYLQVSSRRWYQPSVRSHFLGFRCAKSAE